MKRSSRPAGNIASAVLNAVDLMRKCDALACANDQLERGFKHQPMLKTMVTFFFLGILEGN